MSRIKLTIDNKELEYYCGLGFLGDLLENQDIKVDDIGLKLSTNPFKYVPLFMYESALHGCKRNNTELGFTFYEFTDMLQRDGGFSNKAVNKYINLLTKTLNPKLPNDGIVENAKNKKESKKK